MSLAIVSHPGGSPKYKSPQLALLLYISLLLFAFASAIELFGTNPEGVPVYVDIPPNPIGQYSSLNTTVNMGFDFPYFKTLEVLNEEQYTTVNSIDLFVVNSPGVQLFSQFEHSTLAFHSPFTNDPFGLPLKSAFCHGFTYNPVSWINGAQVWAIGPSIGYFQRMYTGYIPGTNSYPWFGARQGGAYTAHEWTTEDGTNRLFSRVPLRGQCKMSSIKQVKMIARMSWEKNVYPLQTWLKSGWTVQTNYASYYPKVYLTSSPTFQSVSYLYSNHPLTGYTTPPIQPMQGSYGLDGEDHGVIEFKLTMLAPINLNETGFVLMGPFLVKDIQIDQWFGVDGTRQQLERNFWGDVVDNEHNRNFPKINQTSTNAQRVEYNKDTGFPAHRIQPAYPLFETKIAIDEFFNATKISSLVVRIYFKEPPSSKYEYNLATALRLVMVQREHINPRYHAPQLTWRSGTPLLMGHIRYARNQISLVEAYRGSRHHMALTYTFPVAPPIVEPRFNDLVEDVVSYSRFPSYWMRIMLYEYQTWHQNTLPNFHVRPNWYSPAFIPTFPSANNAVIGGISLFSPLLAHIDPQLLENDYFGQWRNSLGALSAPDNSVGQWLSATRDYSIIASAHPRIIGPRTVELDGIATHNEVFDIKFTYIGYVPQSATIIFKFEEPARPSSRIPITNAVRSYVDIDEFGSTGTGTSPQPFIIKKFENATMATHYWSNQDCDVTFSQEHIQHYYYFIFLLLSYYKFLFFSQERCILYKVPLAIQPDFPLQLPLRTHLPTVDASFSFPLTRRTNGGYQLPVNAYGIFDDEIYPVNDWKQQANLTAWFEVYAEVREEDYSPVRPVPGTHNAQHNPKFHYSESSSLMSPFNSPIQVINITVPTIIPPTIPVVARNVNGTVYNKQNHRVLGNIMHLTALRTTLPQSSESFNSNSLSHIILKPGVGTITGTLEQISSPNNLTLSITPSLESQIGWNFIIGETNHLNTSMTANVTSTDLILTFDELQFLKTEPLPLWNITVEKTSELLPNNGFNYIPIDGSIDPGTNVAPFTFTTSIVFYSPSIVIQSQSDDSQSTIPIDDGTLHDDEDISLQVTAGTSYLVSINEDDDQHASKSLSIDLIDFETKTLLYPMLNVTTGTISEIKDQLIDIPVDLLHENVIFQFTFVNQDDVVVVVESAPFSIIPRNPCDKCDVSQTESCVSDEGVCHCQFEYQGARCENRKPCLHCNSNGLESCLESTPDGICVCKPEYGGDTCAEREKCLGCMGDGYDYCDVSTSDGICVCKQEYTGSGCDILKCSQCHDIGTDGCDTNTLDGDCICKKGYGGIYCDILQQCLQCTGKGYDHCDESIIGGKCICQDGWIGEKCDSELEWCQHCVQKHLGGCDLLSNDDGSGKNNGDDDENDGNGNDSSNKGICKCIAGWSGELCDVPVEMESCEYCNQSGLEQCLPATDEEPNGVCECKPTYIGRECNDEILVKPPSEDEPTQDEPLIDDENSSTLSVMRIVLILVIVVIVGI